MNDIATFLSLIGDVPAITDAATVQRRSLDMSTFFSPTMRREAAEKFADLIVKPRSKADVLQIARAAARARMPLMMRGAGTCNFGQGVPLKARPTGWELRIHPSTKRASTIAGFIAGGHAGIGSVSYGILRDRGNIVALEVTSVEEEPRSVEIRGDDVNLVHHAYGTNGIITEVEMPLAYAWPWVETVANFPDFGSAARFAYELASSDGIIKKVITLDAPPNWEYMPALRPIGRAGWTMVRSMVTEQSLEAFRAVVTSLRRRNHGRGTRG